MRRHTAPTPAATPIVAGHLDEYRATSKTPNRANGRTKRPIEKPVSSEKKSRPPASAHATKPRHRLQRGTSIAG
jgi:hypothetical protein